MKSTRRQASLRKSAKPSKATFPKRRAAIGALPAALSLGLLTALGGCGLWYEDHELRYRLTVEVATPTGPRTGSGVVEVTARETPVWDLGRPVQFMLDGEALPVDLPNGRTLFALLNRPGHPDDPMHRAFTAFAEVLNRPEFQIEGRGPDRAKQFAYLRREKATATLEGDERPFLVMFENIRDPASIEAVDPDDLAASLGPGYSLLSVTITITEDDVTTGLRKRLPWVTEDEGKRLQDSADPFDLSVAATLAHGAFVRGH